MVRLRKRVGDAETQKLTRGGPAVTLAGPDGYVDRPPCLRTPPSGVELYGLPFSLPPPDGLPEGLPCGLPKGLPCGLPEGLPFGLPEGLPEGLPYL